MQFAFTYLFLVSQKKISDTFKSVLCFQDVIVMIITMKKTLASNPYGSFYSFPCLMLPRTDLVHALNMTHSQLLSCTPLQLSLPSLVGGTV